MSGRSVEFCHTRPGPRKLLHDLEIIKPHFMQYYFEDCTYEDIATLISEKHGFTASVSTYKKLPRRWNLPSKNFSAADKEAELAARSELSKEQRSTRSQIRPCPQGRLARYQRDKERKQLRKGFSGVSTKAATAPVHKSDNAASSANAAQSSKEEWQVQPYNAKKCVERVVTLPDTWKCLAQVVHYTQEYCLLCAGENDVSMASGGWPSLTPRSLVPEQIGKALPWHAYSKYYQAFEMLDFGNSTLAVQLMTTAGEHIQRALLTPDPRLLSNLLWICFIDCSHTARNYLEHAVRFFVRKAKETPNVGPEHPLSRILGAIALVDLASTDTKAAIARQFVEGAEPLGCKNFNAVYEGRELLMKLLIQLGQLDEAMKQCQSLLDLSLRYAGCHCDNTYRVRRWQGRILARQGLISAAEDAFRALLQDRIVNADSYVDSADRKEWLVWEDLSRICTSREEHNMAEQYEKLAFESSVEIYGECAGNTLRILADLIDLLSTNGHHEDVLALSDRFPRAFNSLSKSRSG